jgi:hypothetical protein
MTTETEVKHTPTPWEVAPALSGKIFIAIEHNIGMAGKRVCEVLSDIPGASPETNAEFIVFCWRSKLG